MKPLRMDWSPHPRVRSLVTTRLGGVSRGPWRGDIARPDAADGLNLGAHCGDDEAAVAENRRRLRRMLPDEPAWLRQVHGTSVWLAQHHATTAPEADAAVTDRAGRVLAIMTADCLPVLFAALDGRAVGAAHAGWRGLANGVVERTVEALQRLAPGARWSAFLGPAIGATAFEVGDDVREAFCDVDTAASAAFAGTGRPGKWLADLRLLATRRLQACGIERIAGDPHCTVNEPELFYSYRRDRITGRMASLIWLEP